MDYIPPEFAKIPWGTVTAAACSPRVQDPNFIGIVIRVPERIVARPREKLSLPICGYYQLETAPLLAGPKVHIHVRTADGSASQSGQVIADPGKFAPIVPMPDDNEPTNPSDSVGQVSESYFYYDAIRYLPHTLPPGMYDICVTYGTNRSNVARVHITAS